MTERSSSSFSAWPELANLYMDLERWDDAVRWYREAVALSPALPNVLTDLGASLDS